MTRQTTTILWLAAALGLWWWLRRPAAATLLPMPGAGDNVYRPTGAENFPYAGG